MASRTRHTETLCSLCRNKAKFDGEHLDISEIKQIFFESLHFIELNSEQLDILKWKNQKKIFCFGISL